MTTTLELEFGLDMSFFLLFLLVFVHLLRYETQLTDRSTRACLFVSTCYKVYSLNLHLKVNTVWVKVQLALIICLLLYWVMLFLYFIAGYLTVVQLKSIVANAITRWLLYFAPPMSNALQRILPALVKAKNCLSRWHLNSFSSLKILRMTQIEQWSYIFSFGSVKLNLTTSVTYYPLILNCLQGFLKF